MHNLCLYWQIHFQMSPSYFSCTCLLIIRCDKIELAHSNSKLILTWDYELNWSLSCSSFKNHRILKSWYFFPLTDRPEPSNISKAWRQVFNEKRFKGIKRLWDKAFNNKKGGREGGREYWKRNRQQYLYLHYIKRINLIKYNISLAFSGDPSERGFFTVRMELE